MATILFKNPEYAHYHYDTETGMVVSTLFKKPRNVTWQTNPIWAEPRVALRELNTKLTRTYSKSDLMNLLDIKDGSIDINAPVTEQVKAIVQAQAERDDVEFSVGLNLLRPSYNYVLFSTEDEASRFFKAGTSIAEAMASMASHNMKVDMSNIKVLNTSTNAVSSLKVQQIKTYSLI